MNVDCGVCRRDVCLKEWKGREVKKYHVLTEQIVRYIISLCGLVSEAEGVLEEGGGGIRLKH